MRTVLIVTNALRAEANALGDAMGWGFGNYGMPLSPTGAEPATHWAVAADTSATFKALIADASIGVVPEGMAGFASVLATLFNPDNPQLLVSFNEVEKPATDGVPAYTAPAYSSASAHFAAVLGDQGLVRIVPAPD